MLRTLWFFLKLALAVAAISWLLRHPGDVTLDFPPYRIETSLALIAAIVFLVIWLSVTLMRLRDTAANMPAHWQRWQEQKGLRALTRGFVAIAAGDSDAAAREAKRADKYLPQTPLKNLLLAQSEQLRGNRAGAAKYFVALMQDKETSFLGLRGLLNQAMTDGKWTHALHLARQAYQSQPKSASLWRHLFLLEARAANWSEAELILKKIERAKALPRDIVLRHHAALLCEKAKIAEQTGEQSIAQKFYKRAYLLSPDFIPAATLYVESLYKSGSKFLADRAIQRVYKNCPHPDVASLALRYGGGNPALLGRLLRKLELIQPDQPATHFVYVEYALSQELWGVAASHMQRLMAAAPTFSHYRLLQRVLQSLPNNVGGAVRIDLQKLQNQYLDQSQLQPDDAWICEECRAPSGIWHALCQSCGAFDSLDWIRPERFVRLPHAAVNDIVKPRPQPAFAATSNGDFETF